MIRIFTLP